MARTLFLFIPLLLMLGACRSNNVNPDEHCQLTEMLATQGPMSHENVSWQRPIFDEQGRLWVVRIPNPKHSHIYDSITISYDEQNRRKSMRFDRDITFQIPSHDVAFYTYQPDGKLANIDLYYYQENYTTKLASYLHRYENDKLASITIIYHNNGRSEHIWQYDYTWEGSKLVRREDYALPESGNPKRRVLRLAFDDKQRPDVLGMQPTIHSDREFNYFVAECLIPVPHNLVSVHTDLYENGKLVSAGYYLNTYTYTTRNKPLQQTTTYNHGAKQVYRFTYQCP